LGKAWVSKMPREVTIINNETKDPSNDGYLVDAHNDILILCPMRQAPSWCNDCCAWFSIQNGIAYCKQTVIGKFIYPITERVQDVS
jgi:hypothetical protein